MVPRQKTLARAMDALDGKPAVVSLWDILSGSAAGSREGNQTLADPGNPPSP